MDGQAAFDLGNVCDTCPFYFERLRHEAEGGSPAVAVVEAFRAGVEELSPSLLEAISPVVPAGEYRALLLDVLPELVWPGGDDDYFAQEHAELFGFDDWWGLPQTPRTPYYRTGNALLGETEGAFEFVVPLVPPRFLDAEPVAEYARAGRLGAALAIGVMDVKTPAVWTYDRGLPYPPSSGEDPRLHSHWCLTHYLIDGHHKTYAAADCGRRLRLISLVAHAAGVSSEDELDSALAALDASVPVE